MGTTMVFWGKPRNPARRVVVSATESWDMGYFVEQYLRSRSYSVNERSRETIRGWIEKYPGRHEAVDKAVLEAWLDAEIAKASAT